MFILILIKGLMTRLFLISDLYDLFPGILYMPCIYTRCNVESNYNVSFKIREKLKIIHSIE